jgi:hypothetical protein
VWAWFGGPLGTSARRAALANLHYAQRRIASYPGPVNLAFDGEIVFWRGPAPYYFVPVPDDQCGAIEAVAPMITYGWGCIPVEVTIGATRWKTSLFPKNGGYLVPVRANVRKSEDLDEGDMTHVELALDV